MPSEHARQEATHAGSKHTPGAKQARDAIVAAFSSVANTIANKADASRKQERREDIGNKIIAALTLFFIFLTTVGIFLQYQIFYRQLTAFEGEARLRLRAYLSFFAKRAPLEAGQFAEFTVTAQGSGQTPALEFTDWGRMAVKPYPLNGEKLEMKEEFPFPVAQNKMSLSPGERAEMPLRSPTTLTQETINGIAKGAYRYYVWGGASYKDVFGCKRRELYCFVVNDTKRPATIERCAEYNESEGPPGECPGD